VGYLPTCGACECPHPPNGSVRNGDPDYVAKLFIVFRSFDAIDPL